MTTFALALQRQEANGMAIDQRGYFKHRQKTRIHKSKGKN